MILCILFQTQKLVLAFDNVQSVAFRGLHVDEALEVGSKSYLNYEGCVILKILYV